MNESNLFIVAAELLVHVRQFAYVVVYRSCEGLCSQVRGKTVHLGFQYVLVAIGINPDFVTLA